MKIEYLSPLLSTWIVLLLWLGCGQTALAGLPPGNVCAASTQTGLYSGYGNCSIVINGVTRTYALHIPSNYVVGNPLIIGLHPAGGSGSTFQSTTGYSALGNTIGFVTAFPDGGFNSAGKRTWNVANNTGYDDLGFLTALITQSEKRLHTSVKRTHLVGFSAGAYMAHSMASAHPALTASMAMVEGSFYSPAKIKVPAGPVAVLILEGADDTTVPECGMYTSVSDDVLFNYWVSADKSTVTAPNLALCLTGAQSNVTHKLAHGITSNSGVEFYKLFNTGHAWVRNDLSIPSGSLPWNPNVTTGTTEPNLIIRFFYAHPQP